MPRVQIPVINADMRTDHIAHAVYAPGFEVPTSQLATIDLGLAVNAANRLANFSTRQVN